jgi:antitoxin (DNA-binding transcriptional repressor) of toxin-antitoxin stability system
LSQAVDASTSTCDDEGSAKGEPATTVTLQEAQARLPELIGQLHAREELVITRDHKPVARLVGESISSVRQRQLRTLKGSVLYMAPSFDAPVVVGKSR